MLRLTLSPRGPRSSRFGRLIRRSSKIFALLTALIASPSSAETYIVDQTAANCPTEGNGSPDSAYCTITAAVAAHKTGGDTIYVQAGTYRERIDIKNVTGASLTTPYVLLAAPGVTIDAMDDSTNAAWSQYQTSAVYALTMAVEDSSRFGVISNLGRHTNQLAGTIDQLGPRTFRYTPSTQTLYVNLGGSAPGPSNPVYLGERIYNIQVENTSYVHVIGLSLAKANRQCFRATNSTYCIVSNCTATDAKTYGFYVIKGDHNTLQFNYATASWNEGLRADSSSSNLLRYNEVYANGRDGIRIQGGTADVAHGNYCHNNSAKGIYINGTVGASVAVDSNTVISNEHGVYVERATDVTITDCTASENTNTDNAGSGIFVTQSSEVTLTDNTVSANNRGIYISLSHGTTIAECTATSNTHYGIRADDDSATTITSCMANNNVGNGTGIYGLRNEALQINGGSANGNAFVGVRIDNSTLVTLSGVTASGNNEHGFRLRADTSLTATAISAYENDHNGLLSESGTGLTATGGTFSSNAWAGFYSDTTLAVTVHECVAALNGYEGIRVKAATGATGNSLTGCTSFRNGRQGILVERGGDHSVDSNTVSYNKEDGILLKNAANCRIAKNESGFNRDSLRATPRATGIRIGDTADTLSQHNNVIECNRVHHNEDTGIEFRASANDTSRRNVSWDNYDHGFDHAAAEPEGANVGARGTIHVGDVAWSNRRDGLSIEKGCPRVEMYNCILAHNARDTSRTKAARQLYVGDTLRFAANYNIIWSGDADTLILDHPLIQWTDDDALDMRFMNLTRWHDETGNDGESGEAQPAFADTGSGDFRLLCGSAGIDSADASVAGWNYLDPDGRQPQDIQVVPNDGTGRVAYADRGAYERYDPPPGTTDLSLLFGRTTVAITLATPGEDGMEGTADYYEVRIGPTPEFSSADTIAFGDPSPGGSVECFWTYGLEACNDTFYVFLKVVDACGDTSMSWDYGVTRCDYREALCDGARGARLVEVSKEEGSQGVIVPLELALSGPQPNPVQGSARVILAVPADLDGAPYELALFDVAGRRVGSIGKGVAKMGEATFELTPFLSGKRQAGVYFLRLRIGTRTVDRTVVLAP